MAIHASLRIHRAHDYIGMTERREQSLLSSSERQFELYGHMAVGFHSRL